MAHNAVCLGWPSCLHKLLEAMESYKLQLKVVECLIMRAHKMV